MTAFLETGVLGQSTFRSGHAGQSSEDDRGSGSSVREQCGAVRSSPLDEQDHCCGRKMGCREVGRERGRAEL